MKIRLSNKDAVELARAINGGCLDTDKVECLKSLVANYNPPKLVGEQELDYFKDCLYRGWGFTPNDEASFFDGVCKLAQTDAPALYDKWVRQIKNGQLYCQFIRMCFIGLLAVKAVGGKFDLFKEADFSFMGEPTPGKE